VENQRWGVTAYSGLVIVSGNGALAFRIGFSQLVHYITLELFTAGKCTGLLKPLYMVYETK